MEIATGFTTSANFDRIVAAEHWAARTHTVRALSLSLLIICFLHTPCETDFADCCHIWCHQIYRGKYPKDPPPATLTPITICLVPKLVHCSQLNFRGRGRPRTIAKKQTNVPQNPTQEAWRWGFGCFLDTTRGDKQLCNCSLLPLWPSSGTNWAFFVKNYIPKIGQRTATGKRSGRSTPEAFQLSAIYLATSVSNLTTVATTELRNLGFSWDQVFGNSYVLRPPTP